MTDLAIEIDDLRVTAGGRTILQLAHLAVEAGEVFAVLGPNGAGKSTLLNVCLGFRRGVAGRITVLSRPVHRLSSAGLTRLRRHVGYIPQALAGRGEMPLTIREVVAIGRTGIAGLLRPLRAADWRIVDEWIDRLGLAAIAAQSYSDASGGEQRKALIARAMVQQPRLLMLDEPTANLDLGWREQIVAVMGQLHRQTGVTIVLVCHQLEVLPSCCGRVMLLEAGRAVAVGAVEEVLLPERIADMYGANLAVVHKGGRHCVIPSGEGGR